MSLSEHARPPRGRLRADGAGVETVVPLPDTRRTGRSVEDAIVHRRSRREYDREPLLFRELTQILWASQGVTDRTTGHRAVPSVGATYPLVVYVAAATGGVRRLDAGVYRYEPVPHALTLVRPGDVHDRLRDAALSQSWVGTAPVAVVLCAEDERTTARYGERGRDRYVPMEAGHVGQNLYLQVESLGLATVAVCAFHDGAVLDALGAPPTQRPLAIYPVGRRV